MDSIYYGDYTKMKVKAVHSNERGTSRYLLVED